MNKIKRCSFKPSGRKRAFTLLELLVSLALASVLILLLTQMLSTGLGGASHLSRSMSRENDIHFALRVMMDELESADAIYKLNPHAIQVYERQPGSNGHRVVTYELSEKNLVRYGDHHRLRYDPDRIGKRPGVKTVMLRRVKDFDLQLRGDALAIRLETERGKAQRVLALRGRYD